MAVALGKGPASAEFHAQAAPLQAQSDDRRIPAADVSLHGLVFRKMGRGARTQD
jgi:hypothetical protein